MITIKEYNLEKKVRADREALDAVNNAIALIQGKMKNEETQNKIVQLSSKLAEHTMMEIYHVSQDMLFDENGNYLAKFQDEFCMLYDEYYNELKNLIYEK